MRTDSARGPILGRYLIGALLALLVLAPAASAQTTSGEDKAMGRPASASSTQRPGGQSGQAGCVSPACDPGKAVDGNPYTRWGSDYVDNQYWQVDLGSVRLVNTVRIDWQRSFALRYAISTSVDGSSFTPSALQIFPVASGLPGRGPEEARTVSTSFPAVGARYVRVQGFERFTQFGISFWTARVLGPADPPPAPPAAQGPASTPSAPPAATPTAPNRTPPASTPGAPPAATARPATFIGPFPIVRIRGRLTSRGARISLLSVRAPRGSRVEVRCRGRRCPQRRTVMRNRRGTVRVASFQRYLRTGTVLEIFVTQRGRVGKYTRFRIRGRRAPVRTDACVAYGSHRPVVCRVG